MSTTLDIVRIPVLSDNYVWLMREPQSGAVGRRRPGGGRADPGRGGKAPLEDHPYPEYPSSRRSRRRQPRDQGGDRLHHRRARGATARASPASTSRSTTATATASARPRRRSSSCPGHTSGHIAYAFRDQQALFCGDTIFALGCGKMFEGTPQQFWTSLEPPARAARRHARLLRPRIHPVERPLRRHHRDRQQAADGALGLDRRRPRPRRGHGAVAARRGEGNQPVPARRRAVPCRAAVGMPAAIPRRCSPRCATARTCSASTAGSSPGGRPSGRAGSAGRSTVQRSRQDQARVAPEKTQRVVHFQRRARQKHDAQAHRPRRARRTASPARC